MTALAQRWMIAGEWRAHPVRVVTAVVAIAVGVALGFAVHLVNASALDRFARGLQAVNGGADLRIEAAGPTGFDERLYPATAHVAGIAGASPVVLVHARVGGAAIDLIGLDVLRAGVVTPALLPKPVTRGDQPGAPADTLFDPASVFLSPAALSRLTMRTGDTLALTAGARIERFRVAGTVPGAGAEQAIGVTDIAGAQLRFGRLGRLDRIDLRLAPDADPARVRSAIQALLPADAVLATGAEDARRTDALSRAYRVNLDMLALVALLTGAFLVYSAQALSVTRRRPQFALLRVIGGTRGGVLRQVLAEGAILGVIGAALGLAAGIGIAAAVLRLVGGDLGSGYFSGAGGGAPPLELSAAPMLTFAGLGLVAALAGSLLPAAAAARTPPALALKDLGDAIDPRRHARIAPAAVLAALGLVAALLPAVGGLPLFGYVAMALLLAAGIGAMPWLARLLLAPLARAALRVPALDLAAKRLWGAPGQAAIALSGIVASTALTVAMAVMVASFRGSVDEWLGQVLPADLYVSAAAGAPFDPPAQARLAAVPGVRRITFALQRPLTLAVDRPPVTLVVRSDPGNTYPAIGRAAAVPADRLALWISEPASRLFHLRAGDALRLPIGGGVTGTVAGVFRDYARQDGAIAIRATDYDQSTGDRARSEAAVDLVAGADPARVAAALTRALPAAAADATVVPVAALRARALAIFDRSFAITYGLEAVALAVGLAGVAATISAQVIARTREFGMLRHLGLTRGEIVGMVAAEGALLGLIGGIAGIGLGAVLAQVLIQVVNPQSFNWTMATRTPWGLLVGVGGALVLSASVTAVLAGRGAVSMSAVRAVRDDW